VRTQKKGERQDRERELDGSWSWRSGSEQGPGKGFLGSAGDRGLEYDSPKKPWVLGSNASYLRQVDVKTE
jgi:hypothetical protein